MTLEEKLNYAFNEFRVSAEDQDSIENLLTVLKQKHRPTYEHSVRVGVLSARIGNHMHLDPKALLFAGTLHDIGKTLLDPELLDKTQGFNEEDMGQMQKHPEYAYKILRGMHEFSGEVVLRHHIWQDKGYPEELPESKIDFSKQTKLMIDFYARLLSLADFYDAITSRVNDRFGEKRKLYPEEIRALMLAKNPDQIHLIKDLYDNGIFGDQEEKTTALQDFIYGSVWKEWDGKRNPKETRRYVTLACALEPLSQKAGCTTRSHDANPWIKLEYFIAAAINMGDSFEELSERILNSDGQPQLIYDLAYRAQEEGIKNRGGGRINQGIIEMLMPIVSAQMLFDKNYQLSASQILERTEEILKNTSHEDVKELVRMKRLAYDLSAYHDREIPEYPEAQNVFEYYAFDLENSETPTSIAHNQELVRGFPRVKEMYERIMTSEEKRFTRKVEDAYAHVRAKGHEEIGEGLFADFSACSIYLALSHNPKEKIIT